ncbi:MAG TPA: U32 family peptidase [Bryobacteraceae bacterium]|nr:U32 family peptidase [Bryobacteraceae bacterium]
MSPAGHWPQLRAAVEAGADAVYFGLRHFSARAKVGFTLAELPEAVRLLHGRGVRGYLTFNTLVFEHELAAAAQTIAAVAEAGIDALIVQDVGILQLAREIAPDLELHASTQMSITDAAGVRFARDLGVHRVTLARELSLSEVRTIFEQTACELEIFVHGALCVAYSGQCFSSEAWGGRSANRGQCAQACRLSYDLMVDGEQEPLGDARYLLSPGDLCTVSNVPEIVAAGVASLKIEGRYKDADYVALTTKAYRDAVDRAWAGLEADRAQLAAEMGRLEQVYSRGLGPWFASGTNHQSVVRGRAPRHRGVCAGKVVSVLPESVVIAPERIASPLKPGDGVVFDAADWRSPGEPEEGGRLYSASPRAKNLEIAFANGAIRFDRIRPGDLVWRTDDPALHAFAKPYTEAPAPVRKQRVDAAVSARAGSPLEGVWTCGAVSVTVTSDSPLSAARNQGLSLEVVKEQFSRLGNTPYELGEVTLHAEGAPFVPSSVLNSMRRQAVEQLQAAQTAPRELQVRAPAAVLERFRSEAHRQTSHDSRQLHLLVRTPEQLEAALHLAPSSITLDYLDLYGLRPSVEQVRSSAIPVRVASPRVLKPGEARIVNFLRGFECPIVVRASGILHSLADREMIGDFSLNAANSIAAAEYFRRGVSRLTPTHDLNAAQIADLAGACGADRFEVIAYQHLPVFHTEHCVFCRFLSTGTSYKDCGRPCEKHRVELRDESGRSHPVLADVGCRNTVFGAEAQEASQHLKSWLDAGIRHFRLEFAHETGSEVELVTRAFQQAITGDSTFAQLQRELKATSPGGITQGSLFVSKDYLSLPILQ